MEDRRKIVIPLQPETPHFDAEETLLSARPVVPITHAEPPPQAVFNGPEPSARTPFHRRSMFLPLVVIAAVSIGLAAGLGIARYRYVQPGASTVVAQPAQAPAASDTRTTTAAATQTPKGDEQAQAPALPEVKIEEKTIDDTSKEDEAQTVTPGASKKSEDDAADRKSDDGEDNARTTQPDTRREKRRAGDDADETQDTPRSQRRDRRVRDRNDEADIPRRIERASEQINRIREIFEGRPQRP
ncbi:MAG TPA: hypothetical protein VJS44_07190 [Pyrinomonadaceae bacterium]|nr:hypothetical protein [Pyrinomonadaceae bacterium]